MEKLAVLVDRQQLQQLTAALRQSTSGGTNEPNKEAANKRERNRIVTMDVHTTHD